MAAQHLVIDRHRTQTGRFPQKRHDLSLEDMFQRIRPPLARLRLLRRKARVLRDPVAGGPADVRLGGGHLDGMVLSELHEKSRLLIGYLATRHKGGSPFQKTASVSGRPRSQTQELHAEVGMCLQSGYALLASHTHHGVSSRLTQSLTLIVAQQRRRQRAKLLRAKREKLLTT